MDLMIQRCHTTRRCGCCSWLGYFFASASQAVRAASRHILIAKEQETGIRNGVANENTISGAPDAALRGATGPHGDRPVMPRPKRESFFALYV
ncbi:MAG: hypothetical protein ACKVP3_21135 [Hyphomicrobiaceae bacterium]